MPQGNRTRVFNGHDRSVARSCSGADDVYQLARIRYIALADPRYDADETSAKGTSFAITVLKGCGI